MHGDSEELVNYNLLFCHACLSSNRALRPVGDYVDIYVKICDKSRMKLTSQVNVCWECMALLKKVHAFRKMVENAQKILDDCINKQVPLDDNLSRLTINNTDITTYGCYPTRENGDADDYGHFLEEPDEVSEYMEQSDLRTEDLNVEQMFRIEDVRGQCDILDVRPILDLSTGSLDAPVRAEPGSPEDDEGRRHRRWKRCALLVYKSICSHRYAHHFLRPVSDELAPLYSRIVRRPTDLSTIRRRIKEDVIRTTAELTRALLLMFSNALMYNSSYHKIYQMALEFQDDSLRELSVLQAALAAEPGAVAARRRRSASAAALKAPQPVARRRATMWDAPREDKIKTAVAPRPPRRASVYVPARTAEHPPAKRRTKWDWPGVDNDQYLVANGFKKYKSTVLL